MDLTLLLVVVLNVLIAGGLLYVVVGFSKKDQPTAAPEIAVDLGPVFERLAQLEADTTETRAAVAIAIEHEERRERRIKAVVARARTQLKKHQLEDGALEAEFGDLRILDGEGGGEEGLPALPPEMGQPQTSTIPGVSVEQLQRARGF